MDRLTAMQTFARVAELGSFTGAAKSLQLPNASVSLRVAQLEEHLGVKLLSRTTRRVSLTEDGAAYLAEAQRLLQALEDLEARTAGAVRSPRGRLRVDVPAAAGRHVLAPALPAFLMQYPEMTVELGSSDRPVDLVPEGVDCVIRGGLVHDDQLVARSLGAFEVVTCASPAYLARHGTPRSPEELSRHLAVNFFSAKTGRVFDFEFERDGRRFEIALAHRAAANDADAHVALALAGLGLAQCPRTRIIAEHIAAGRLVPVLADWSAGRLPLYVMYPRNRHLSARVRAFVDWVVELYAAKFEQLETGAGLPGKRTSPRPRARR
ncbi:MAG: LysR family transcriptional regulator [Pseudomonadota bacterium]